MLNEIVGSKRRSSNDCMEVEERKKAKVSPTTSNAGLTGQPYEKK